MYNLISVFKHWRTSLLTVFFKTNYLEDMYMHYVKCSVYNIGKWIIIMLLYSHEDIYKIIEVICITKAYC